MLAIEILRKYKDWTCALPYDAGACDASRTRLRWAFNRHLHCINSKNAGLIVHSTAGTHRFEPYGNISVTPLAFALMAASSIMTLDATELAQLTIQQRVVVRVPLAPPQTGQQAPLRWLEKKGPKCIGLGSLAGFVVRGPQTVDLFMRGGQRVRTRLEKQCTRVDLGYGFYIRPNADGRICTNRDTLHARTGGRCEVERFTNLVPER